MTSWRHKKVTCFRGDPPPNFCSLASFVTKLCQLTSLIRLINNLGKFFGHLSGACILQTRVKITILVILIGRLDQFASNFAKMLVFVRQCDLFKKKLIPVCKIHVPGRSVNYTFQHFQNSRTRSAFDLIFSPVIGLDQIRSLEKFWVGHLFGWYFTDRSVNYQLAAILNVLVVRPTWNFHQLLGLIKGTHLQKISLITWSECILQTRPKTQNSGL